LVDAATLLDRCRRGDDLAWEALVRTHQSSVYAVTRYYLRDSEEARDVAQDVFVRLYERLASFEGGDTFKAWLLRMARNACIDRLRRIKARPPATDVPVDDAGLVSGDDPEASAQAEARERLLRRAVAELGEKNREVLLLKEIQGLKLEEVAEILSLPLGTVKSRSSRARLELAAALRRLDPSFGTGTP
jgi:RNA polymerase sigma-70 factor (ECF subfamily)